MVCEKGGVAGGKSWPRNPGALTASHTEGTIMAAILCDQVAPGMRPSERCISVRDVRGHREWLLVEHDFLTVRQGKAYLSVGIVQADRDQDLFLVEFPHEAATGGNRMWVRASDVIEGNGAAS
jgi:hypothetical protein